MKNLRSYFFGLLLSSFLNAFACQCPPTTLSTDECEKYDIIFRGKVKSVNTCGERLGEASFEIEELYKGNIPSLFTVLFKCNDPCYREFQVGEEWIIYTRYKQVTNAMMDWCSRSRKYFAVAKQDFYEVNYGNSYEEEFKFLTTSLGIHRPMTKANNADVNRNLRPSMTQTILILICSLVAMVMFYWLIRKYFNRL